MMFDHWDYMGIDITGHFHKITRIEVDYMGIDIQTLVRSCEKENL
jgi:hypothetical protein